MSKVKAFIRSNISRPYLQPIWYKLNKLAMAGMNWGGGYGLDSSGEVEFLKHWALHLKSHPEKFLVADVGANCGEFTKYCLDFFSQNISVECFEPQPNETDILKQKYGNESRVKLHPVAVGSKPGTMTLYGYQGAASLYAWNAEKYGLAPIPGYDVGWEIFKTCNLAAIHRTHPLARNYQP